MTMCQTIGRAVEQSVYYVISNETSEEECLNSNEKEEELEARAAWVIQAEADVEHEQGRKLLHCNFSLLALQSLVSDTSLGRFCTCTCIPVNKKRQTALQRWKRSSVGSVAND